MLSTITLACKLFNKSLIHMEANDATKLKKGIVYEMITAISLLA